ncbi:hypothetical protein ZYGM_004002 [Zygosaccharomyces mellis]|uniref:Acyl-protein thioesterase 1 n=1 Tax=Zygosaccharomyces mellis TaxID=42258 RepID=A0A4C2E6I9_9SACH|nr:hypothetical protein ZYGM_004002 [Zygosaccharomyces mellis]
MASLSAVRVAARSQPAEKALIVFHGLGDSGHGWSFLADYLQRDPSFKSTRFIFPNAPTIPISCYCNMQAPGWFDIPDIGFSQEKADVEGTLRSVDTLQAFVQEQIDKGIRPENIIVGGFSQGAALALAASALLPFKIGGFFCLSGFCQIQPRLMQLKNNINNETPMFHGHGDEDPIVWLSRGQEAYEFFIREVGLRNYEFHIYKGMEHSSSAKELQELIQFIKNSLHLNA